MLSGKKRFVLFPPQEVEHLYPYGQLDKLHENGLISYKDAPVRSDGLPFSVALKARIKALEAKLEAIPTGKGKGKQDPDLEPVNFVEFTPDEDPETRPFPIAEEQMIPLYRCVCNPRKCVVWLISR